MSQRQVLLIVEDDADVRRMFKTALAFAGYEILEAGDGYTALQILDQQRPAAVVLDLGLPTISGHVVLEDLAARALTREIPVIVVTALDIDDAPGAACLLRKPVTPDKLVETVKRCIAAGAGDGGVFERG